jgi:hypothetical protein
MASPGLVPPPLYGRPRGRPTHALAKPALILAVVALPAAFVCPGVNLVLGVLAVALGYTSWYTVRAGNGAQGGADYALAALILGGISTVIGLFVTAAVVVGIGVLGLGPNG